MSEIFLIPSHIQQHWILRSYIICRKQTLQQMRFSLLLWHWQRKKPTDSNEVRWKTLIAFKEKYISPVNSKVLDGIKIWIDTTRLANRDHQPNLHIIQASTIPSLPGKTCLSQGWANCGPRKPQAEN